MANDIIERPAPPRITKADALERITRERGQAHGSVAGLARLVLAARQQVDAWESDADIPELYARRLKDVRPGWFETAQA